jgi:hypothetical protein
MDVPAIVGVPTMKCSASDSRRARLGVKGPRIPLDRPRTSAKGVVKPAK